MMLHRGNLVKSYAKKAQRSILSFCSTKRFSSSSSFVPVQVESFPDLIHQGKVRVQVADDTITRVQVIPILDAQAFGLKAFTKPTTTLDISSLFHITKDYNENQELSTLRIVKIDHPNLVDEDGAPNQIIDLQLYLPHLMDLNISIIRGEVYVKDKIEGNVNVAVGEGEIHANKIRGTKIALKTNRGLVEVSTLVEAENLVVSTSQLECKKIMAGQTEVKLQKGPFDSHIGAIYSSTCMINSASKGKLHIGNSHGYLRIVGEELTKVQVDSINGSFELEDSGEKCDVVAHFDTWHPESDNSILVGGNVKISLDPSTAMEVELHGQNIITTNCQLADGKLEHLDENYAVFNGEIKPDPTVTSVTTADRSGKINVGAARNAALSTSFFMKEDKAKSSNAASIKTQDDEHELGDEDDENHTLTPLNKNPEIARLLVHATGGQVQLEQSNWMDKLKRKLLTENKS